MVAITSIEPQVMCSTPCEDEYSRINGVTLSVVGEGLRTYVYRGECAYIVSVWVVLCNLKKMFMAQIDKDGCSCDKVDFILLTVVQARHEKGLL